VKTRTALDGCFWMASTRNAPSLLNAARACATLRAGNWRCQAWERAVAEDWLGMWAMNLNQRIA
jgi:hypothetical protein